MTSLTTAARLISTCLTRSSRKEAVADRNRIMHPDEVADLIAQGQTIVIYQDYVLHLDSWLDRHPGGRLAILHMVGRDATDEIDV